MSPSSATRPGARGSWAGDTDARPSSSGVRRFQLTVLPFGVGIAGVIFAGATGRAAPAHVLWLTLYTVAGLLTFYVLLKSDKVRRSRDPFLTFPQVIFAIGLVSIAYALITPARGLALQWLVLILAFDMRRMPLRQMLAASALALTLPALGLLAIWHLNGRNFSVLNDLVQLSLGWVILPVLMAVARRAKAVQRRRQAINVQMADVLEQSRLMAIRDPLTGLLNRRYMETLLDQEVRRAERYHSILNVAMVDVDHFKSVNDQYGHAAGDAVLCQFAQISATVFDGTLEYMGRWGGEEFLVVFVDADAERARQRLSALLEAVQSHDWRGQGLPNVTFSAGLCTHQPGADIAAMLEGADQALYRAKQGGRNRIEAHEWPCGEPSPVKKRAPGVEKAASHAARVRLVERPVLPPADAAKPTQAPSRLSTWLFSDHQGLREGLMALLGSACIYAVSAMAVLLHGLPYGVFPAPFGYFLAAGLIASAVLPYALVRSGATHNLKDRLLSMPQIIMAIALSCTVYALVPLARAVNLQLLCVILVFSSVICTPAQAVMAGIAAIGMLLTAFTWVMTTSAPGLDVVKEAGMIGMSSFILALLAAQSRRLAVNRQDMESQRDALAHATREVAHLMMRDTLTGIGNRQFLMAQLDQECARHAQTGRSFCIALLDLDHFKKINDVFGHSVGDEVLIGFSRALGKALRGTDILGRWGGEEFLVIFPETSCSTTARKVLEQVLDGIRHQSLSPTRASLRVTFSAGVAHHAVGEPISDLLSRADKGLYAAKAMGRNRCTLAPLTREDAPSRDDTAPLPPLTSPLKAAP